MLSVEDAWAVYGLLLIDKKAFPGDFHAAIHGSKLLFAKPSPPRVREELVKRREYLRIRAERREYRALTSGVRLEADREGVGKLLPKLGIGLNMVTQTSFPPFFFLRKVTQLRLHDGRWSPAARCLLWGTSAHRRSTSVHTNAWRLASWRS